MAELGIAQLSQAAGALISLIEGSLKVGQGASRELPSGFLEMCRAASGSEVDFAVDALKPAEGIGFCAL